MSKLQYFFMGIIIFGMALLLLACWQNPKGDDMLKNSKPTNNQNDTLPDSSKTQMKESDLTESYDLNELRTFFQGYNLNENVVLNTTADMLSFGDVQRRFPGGITRDSGYSVYKVTQGGYFYVFWTKPVDVDETASAPSVYFSTYLTSDRSPDLFNSLKLGVSTAADVKRIDPSFELSFVLSSGTFSYSYLDKKTVLQIKYNWMGSIEDYDDLIVKEITVVARENTPSSYSTLLTTDVP